MDALLAKYGLIVLFFGSGLEGEFAVVTGGILVRHGSFPLGAAMIVATLGSFFFDQCWYFLGRNARNSRFVKRVAAKPLFVRALNLLERRPVPFILGFRFVYGMRTVSPVAIGVAGVPIRKFLPLNLIAAAIWAPFFTWLGHKAGKAILPMLHRVGHYGLIVLVTALLIAPIIWGAIRWWRGRAIDEPEVQA
ncbi:MAG TPA: DedA family protein [Sphingomonas sp.]|jgi:membrane protein DedA with SNARE-associated domain|nr:DedA family protein [Sphingomonas sp.]